MQIVEKADAIQPPPDFLISDDDFAAVANFAAGPYLVPFEILGESIVPGVSQVPLILQGTFIQITNRTAGGASSIKLAYSPTVPFVASPPGGKISLAANFIDAKLNIGNLTQAFVNSPSGPSITFPIPAGGTVIVGLQYVAVPSSPMAEGLAATEASGNRGSVQLIPQSGGSFLVTGTVRQVFLSQQSFSIISAAAYAVDVAGGPLVTG